MRFLKHIVLALILALIPVATASAETVITASGDYGSSANSGKVIDGIGDINPDAHMAVGDLSYADNSDPNNESDWCDFVNTRLASQGVDTGTFPFQLVAGNHEDDVQENGFIDDFAACLPDRMTSTGTYGAHYYFDVDNVRVIMVSPDLVINGHTYDYADGDADYQDVESWIDDGRTAGQDWIIIGMHEDCMTVGNKSSCQVGTDLMDLLITKDVDVIVHGHDHTYQRSKQLEHGSGCSTLTIDGFSEGCVGDSRPTNAYTKGSGPVDIITATGGKSAYNINTNDPEAGYFLSASGANNNQSFGNLVLTINGNELEGEFRSVTGSYGDKFVITSTGEYIVDNYDTSTDLIGDFTGNGMDDIAIVSKSGDTLSWQVAKSTGHSFQSKGTWKSDFGDADDSLYVGDFNGDGRDDVAYSRVIDANTVRWNVAKSNGTSFGASKTWKADLGNQNSEYYIGDFNGDGRDEIAYSQTSGNTVNWKVALSTGRSFKYKGTWISDMGNSGDTFYIGDFTGNGMDDIAYMRPVTQTALSWRVGSSSGRSFTYRGVWRSSMGDTDDAFKIGDANGDRKDDIIYIRKSNFYTRSVKRSYSSGKSFKTSITLTADYGNDGDRYRMGDFNDNGKDDLTIAHASGASTLSWRVAWLHSFSNRGTWSSDFGNSSVTF